MADVNRIYHDIQTRTGGNIYLGVVGPVRSGKSTFIQQFLDCLVIPHIENEAQRERATDEMPQSSAGRTIMTTEPKFIPEEAVSISLGSNARLNVRLVDCVGFVVPSAIGYIEGENPRMVQTPWSEEPMPFHMAAEMGTKKVMEEHSTVGIVVTTDASFSDIPREEYQLAEERVIRDMKATGKPFAVILNSAHAKDEETLKLAQSLSERYEVPVVAADCLKLTEDDIRTILSAVLFEFPINEIAIELPNWLTSLEKEHWLKEEILSLIESVCDKIANVNDCKKITEALSVSEYIETVRTLDIDLSTGNVTIKAELKNGIFYRLLSEKTGVDVTSEQELMEVLGDLAKAKKEYEKVKNALEEVEQTGYGIVMPDSSQLSLEEPELMKQGGRYGVRLKASAPSIHMLRADIVTEVAPIVGSESQSEDLVLYLMKQFEENPNEIWNSDIFGKSIYSIVKEGLNNKLARMPTDARGKLRETVEKVINEGCNGLICIIL